jgi:hypothetical protein
LLTAAGKQHAQQGDDQRCCPHHPKRSLLQMRLPSKHGWTIVELRRFENKPQHQLALSAAGDR